MFDAAIKKLDGFKVFGELAEEMVDALSEELDNTDSGLKTALAENVNLTAIIAERDQEIERLRSLLQSIEVEL